MKIDQHIVETDPVDEWISQEELAAARQLLSRVRVHKGQQLYEINLMAENLLEAIKPAEYEKTIGVKLMRFDNTAPIKVSGIIKNVIVKRHCIYLPATNPKVAAHKAVKRLIGKQA